jgi:Tfp pilus assembly protein PilX
MKAMWKFRMVRGQILVVVLLMLAVATTVGLAIVSRTITEVSISTTQEESARALAAAEAGIEAALSSVVASGTVTPLGSTGTTYTVSSAPYGSGASIATSKPLTAGEVETIFLSAHDANGNLVAGLNKYTGSTIRLCWGQNSNGNDANAPALEATFYNQTAAGVVRVGHAAFDPNASRISQNSFAAASAASGCPTGKVYNYSTLLTLTGLGNYSLSESPLLLRLRLLYNGEVGHYIGVSAVGGSLPVQGINIVSSGQAGTSTRKVQLFQKFSDTFPQFDNAVFSGASLTK